MGLYSCITNAIHIPNIKFVISSQKEISAMALVTVVVILGGIMSSCLFGQAVAPPRRFEVASVKLSKSVTLSSNRTVAPGGRLTVINATLKSLIQWSYGLPTFQISGGPAWLDSDRFDIEAKPEGSATQLEVMQMVRKRLANPY